MLLSYRLMEYLVTRSRETSITLKMLVNRFIGIENDSIGMIVVMVVNKNGDGCEY